MNNTIHPQVSIIVPVYNVEKYIRRCLESLINQDCTCEYEVIIINDGTEDRSMNIVAEIAERTDKFRIINKQNGGVSSARNAGISAAAGDYIAFVDSDDFVSPDYISAMYTAAVEADADIVCCNYRNMKENGVSGMNNPFAHPSGVFSGGEMLKKVLHDITVRSYLWNKLYRRSIFTDNVISFPEGVNFEDLAVMPKLFYYSKKVAVIKDTLYNYVHHQGSITGSISKKDTENYLRAYASVRVFLEEKNIYREHRLTYYLLRKKISFTILCMLYRCWARDPKNTRVLYSYNRVRKHLKLYTAREYYGGQYEYSLQ